MKTIRLLYSTDLSKCCNVKSLLVRSKEGGLVSRNCLKCGKADNVNESRLPDLQCELCGKNLSVRKKDGINYSYVCGRCGRHWELAAVLPQWSDLFRYSGLAAAGDLPAA